jgi:S-adenosylmethionine:tRNA ribosyltransferase-isomerase
MKVDEFDFALPRALIAERPAVPRESARLLRVTPDGLADHRVAELPGLLAPGDLVVFNDTRVIPARLSGRRGDAQVEVTLHQRLEDSGRRWAAFARPAKRLKPGQTIAFGPDFSALVEEKGEGGEIRLAFDRDGADLSRALDAFGRMPLPPYIRKGLADARDRADYQTLFARADGAVAAPTAGLHFTPALIAALDAAGIERRTVTLHVGAGTFLPVTAEDTRDHAMHAETGIIDAETADAVTRARAEGRRVVAVGTTALRLLESAADPDGTVRPFAGSTAIFITPGYRFRAVDRLLTNFHLPRSTLFMLVAAFSGLGRMRSAYDHAIQAGYRFYSYGDACLLDPAGDCR